MNNANDNESEFKCSGLLGALLELSRLSGVDEHELHEKDEEWSNMLKPVEFPKTLNF